VGGPFHGELTLPNEADGLPLARAFLEQLAQMAALPGPDSSAIVEAALEACANVVDHAYEPGEHGTFTIAADVDATALTVAVRDQGLPIDVERAGTPDASPAGASASDGLAAIQHRVDHAEWIRHGRLGKELRLVKRRPVASVHGHLTADDAPVDHEHEHEVPLAPEQQYTVRRFEAGDAVGVARCIYRVYGNTYMHEACYYPERMVALNDTGELASVVAVDAAGEVVGHYALERPGLTRVAERGMAVVSPAHRGRDLMGRMRTAIEEEARDLGLTGVFSVAVTKHTFSQRVNEAFGSDVCGIVLGGGPATQVFKGLEEEDEQPQRVTWVVYFTYVDPPEHALAHAPARHRAMLERIYAGLGLPVVWHDEQEPPTLGDGQVDVAYHPAMGSATIKVRQVGDDTAGEIRQATRDLFELTGSESVQLWLPLADPAGPALLDVAEALGFSFCGLGPSFLPDGDALCLQRLATDLDFHHVEVASPFSQELLDYVRADLARVKG
jgi:anti-sigma regulatory factor (Ser/Thr protein kinase)/GNAT superfamily N-acetyltransferase